MLYFKEIVFAVFDSCKTKNVYKDFENIYGSYKVEKEM